MRRRQKHLCNGRLSWQVLFSTLLCKYTSLSKHCLTLCRFGMLATTASFVTTAASLLPLWCKKASVLKALAKQLTALYHASERDLSSSRQDVAKRFAKGFEAVTMHHHRAPSSFAKHQACLLSVDKHGKVCRTCLHMMCGEKQAHNAGQEPRHIYLTQRHHTRVLQAALMQNLPFDKAGIVLHLQ